MIVIFFLIILMIALLFCFRYSGEYNENYLSMDITNSWKGVFSLAIIIHHFFLQVQSSNPAAKWFETLGFCSVSVFFFYSGYGLQKSYIKKGKDYRHGFLIKRIPKVLIPYAVFNLLFLILLNAEGNKTGLKDVLLSVLNGEPIVSFSWYVIDILAFYFVYYLLMRICRKKYYLMILLGIVYIIVKTLFCKKMAYGSYWYKTTHMIIVGMIWATYENKIINVVRKRYKEITAATVILSVVMYIICTVTSSKVQDGFNHEIYMLLARTEAIIFVAAVLMLSMSIKGSNLLLKWLGKISYETYLSQGIMFNILLKKGLNETNSLLFAVLTISGTLVISACLNKVFIHILNLYSGLIKKHLN